MTRPADATIAQMFLRSIIVIDSSGRSGGDGTMALKRTWGISLGSMILLGLLSPTLPISAQPRAGKPSADDLVRETVAHELAAVNDGGHYRYRFQEERAKGSQTSDIVETRDWLVGRVIFRDGKPLPAAEEEKETERLQGLLKNPERLEAFQKEQAAHKESIRKMIAAFPDAFICQYAGTGQPGFYQGMVRVKFRPNPKFAAQTMELRPLQAMRGYVWIDPVRERLVRVDARFFREVDFGWGILGSIARGGTMVLEQQPADGERWAISMLELHYNKRVLLMRTRVDSVTKTYEFRRAPGELTVQQGLEELLRGDETVASSRATK
jgi:hypothetical protein